LADLSSIVSVVITRTTASVSRASFSVPLIAAYHTHNTDLVRTYSASTGLAAMVVDGFTTTEPAYLAAVALLSQSPRPKTFKIGRLTASWNQTIVIVPVAANAVVYSGRIADQTWTFTSDADATLAEVCTGIAAAIDALAGVTAVASTTDVTVSVTAAATLVNVSRTGVGVYTWADTTPAGTVATELSAIQAQDPEWYGFVTDRVSELHINAVAAWTETQRKIYLPTSADPGIWNQAVTTDIVSDIKNASLKRTSVWVHENSDEFLGAAMLGLILPFDPGSANWAHKSPAGVAMSAFNATEQAAILAKRGNILIPVAGIGDTQWGTTGSDYLDNVQGEDWVAATVQEDVYAFLHGEPKIPYTDRSVARLRGVIEAVLQRGVENGIIADDPQYFTEAPLVADVSPTDRANRHLPDVVFSFRLSGAINSVSILGLVSV
jgi:hypothetical protein